MKKMSLSFKYYITGLAVIIILPAILLALYEQFAGGVLNGVAGSWREATVDPDVFLIFINPVLLLSGYSLLVYFFRKYKDENKRAINSGLAYLVFVVATIIVIVGVFWKALTA